MGTYIGLFMEQTDFIQPHGLECDIKRCVTYQPPLSKLCICDLQLVKRTGPTPFSVACGQLHVEALTCIVTVEDEAVS